MIEIAKLVQLIDAYNRDHNSSRTAFGKEVTGTPNFVHKLALGNFYPRLCTIQKVVTFLESNGYKI